MEDLRRAVGTPSSPQNGQRPVASRYDGKIYRVARVAEAPIHDHGLLINLQFGRCPTGRTNGLAWQRPFYRFTACGRGKGRANAPCRRIEPVTIGLAKPASSRPSSTGRAEHLGNMWQGRVLSLPRCMAVEAHLKLSLQPHCKPLLLSVLPQAIWAASATSRAAFQKLAALEPSSLTDLERSARFIYLQRLAFGGHVARRTFGVDKQNPARFDVTKLVPLLEAIHDRMAGVVIERMPWADFIDRYDRPGILFYLDPPYFGSENDYGLGMFARDEFARMAARLASLKGRFILSLNDRPEVREIFSGFAMEAVRTTYPPLSFHLAWAGQSGRWSQDPRKIGSFGKWKLADCQSGNGPCKTAIFWARCCQIRRDFPGTATIIHFGWFRPSESAKRPDFPGVHPDMRCQCPSISRLPAGPVINVVARATALVATVCRGGPA